jgi:hypothetical protein
MKKNQELLHHDFSQARLDSPSFFPTAAEPLYFFARPMSGILPHSSLSHVSYLK